MTRWIVFQAPGLSRGATISCEVCDFAAPIDLSEFRTEREVVQAARRIRCLCDAQDTNK